MLEHADGHDAIELLMQIAVILQQDLHIQPGAARLSQLLLFGGNGHADHRHAVMLRRIGGEAAPATADIQQAHARLQLQFSQIIRSLASCASSSVVASFQ